jgi:hypothetical protein
MAKMTKYLNPSALKTLSQQRYAKTGRGKGQRVKSKARQGKAKQGKTDTENLKTLRSSSNHNTTALT